MYCTVITKIYIARLVFFFTINYDVRFNARHIHFLGVCVEAYAYNHMPHMLKPDITHNRRVGLRFEQNRCTDFFNERTAMRKLKIAHAKN